MTTSRVPRFAVGLLALITGLLFIGGAWAYASIPDSAGQIRSCYRVDNGALRVVDTTTKCTKGERGLSWAQQPTAATLGLQQATGVVTVQPGQFGVAYAVCPGGQVAVSGGFQTLNPAVVVTQTVPLGASWAVEAFNGDGAAHDVHAFALCIDSGDTGPR
jgi:hypothetical protein